MSIDEQIALIKQQIQSANVAKIRAEASREAAEVNYNSAKASLLDQYGVDTSLDARAKLAELQQDLESKLAEITSILDSNNS